MCWYIGIAKGVTSGRTPNTVVFKSPVPPTIFSHGRLYHQVKGPFADFVTAREVSLGHHVESDEVLTGRCKKVNVNVILKKKEVR